MEVQQEVMARALSFCKRHWWQLLVLLLAVSVTAIDRLGMGPLGEFGLRYDPMPHRLAPYYQVMASWPWDSASRLQHATIHSMGPHIHGPESLIFDPRGDGPYAGLADGRIVKWSSKDGTWNLFAVPSLQWNISCLSGSENSSNTEKHKEAVCGRPLGLRFSSVDNKLYFADSYYGLMVVGPDGGIASVLTQHAGGEPIKFANDLDIHSNGSIFFTDSSMRHNRLDHQRILLETENTGRLLRYDPQTGETSIVATGFCFPNGVQLSKDESFLLMTETTNCRVVRYWLKGPKTGTWEEFANLPGFPDNIRMNHKGQFWVAIDCCRTRLQEIFSTRTRLRRIFFKLPVSLRTLYKMVGMRMFTMITLFDEEGQIVDSLEDTQGSVVKLVSEVQQKDQMLWIGSVYHKKIATFNYEDK